MFQTAACKDTLVSFTLILKRAVQTSFIQVKGVRILHDESAHAHQTGFWTRLVAKLHLNLIPDLRQLLVRAKFISRYGCEDLFMGHAETHVCTLAIFQAKHVFADCTPT